MAKILEWTTRAQLALTCRKGTRLLAVNVEVDSLLVIALESTMSRAKSTVGRIGHVLDSHAHRSLGIFPTVTAAIAAAEAFASEWDGGTPLALCKCGEAATKHLPKKSSKG